MYYEKLSDLTPEVVDSLYGIDKATPVADPVFVFMIGSPGAGKSQGHAQLAELEILKDKNYCTINLDSLLESLKPFRAGSAIGHLLKMYLGESYPKVSMDAPKSAPRPKTPSFIHTYQSTAENVGAFSFYNDPYTRTSLENAVLEKLGANYVEEVEAAARRNEIFGTLNAVRERFPKEAAGAESIIVKNTEAIIRAIGKGINIVYETTFDVSADGIVKKFDGLYKKLQSTPYYIHVLLIDDETSHIQKKIKARQEYGMPYENYPFYRYVPFGSSIVDMYRDRNNKAVSAIADAIVGGKYDATKVLIHTHTSKFNESRLNPAIEFNFMSQLDRIKKAYSGGNQTRRLRRKKHRYTVKNR